MAFWRRIKQSQIHTKVWNQFKRSYLQIHSPFAANGTKVLVLNCPTLATQKPQFEFPSNVRFFAAPVQIKTKQEEKDTSGPRLNEQITADVVRLVTDEGHSVLSKHEALKLARSLKLDLVEVQRSAKPPVCKLMEYHREKYKQELKEKDRAKKKSELTLRKGPCKEVRFAGNITPKDLQIKADSAKRLMERGFRVKCVAIGNMDKGEDSSTLLSRFSALIEDISIIESDTRVEEKDQAHVIIRHVKYGPLKKGSGKKASRDNKPANGSIEEVESDDGVISEEMTDEDIEQKEQSSWTAFDANDDCDKLFDLKDNLDEVCKSSRSEKLSIVHDTLRSSVGGSSNYASPGGRNTFQSGSRSSDMARQRQLNKNTSPHGRETDRLNSEFSAPENFQLPKRGIPPNIPDSPAPSFGIFSGRQGNNAEGKQSIPAEVNRYKQKNASDSGRNSSSPRRPGGHGSGHMSNSEVGRDEDIHKKGQGRSGVFSGEGSSTIPNRKFEGQAKVQR